MKNNLVALVATVVSIHASAGAPAAYTIIDLGAGFSPTAVNIHGQLVGNSPNGPVTYRHGAWQLLPMSTNPPSGYASGINNHGVIVGYDNTHDVEWIDEVNTPMANARRYASPTGIASDGTVVGYYFGGSFTMCYTWNNGVFLNFYPLAGNNCHAHAIDPSGTYKGGDDWNDNLDQHAFIMGPKGTADLGTFDGTGQSTVTALNKKGHAAVLSTYDGTGQWGAAYWNGRKLVNLGLHATGGQSQATAINISDDVLVVGADHQGHVLFLYSGQSRTTTPIEPLIGNAAGWTFDYATPAAMLAAIGADGSIYGTANLNGEAHAFKLQPTTE